MLHHRAALVFCQGLGCGALSSFGRPGLDFAPAYFAGVVGLTHGVFAAPSWPHALLIAAGWAIGVGVTSGLGAYSWGLDVVAFVIASIALYLGLGLVACRLLREVRSTLIVFSTTLAAWSLWLWAWEDAVIANKPMATSLVRFSPFLVAGSRLVGENVVDAIATAGAVAAGHAWFMLDRIPRPFAQGYPILRWLGRLRSACVPVAHSAGLLALLGIAARASAPAPSGRVSIGVPQLNVESLYYTSRLTAPEVTAAFRQRSRLVLGQLQQAELVVFSEGFDGSFPWAMSEPRSSWQAFAAARHQAVLLTSYALSARGWKTNAVGAIRSDGQIAGEHIKVNLAPFGEAPFDAGAGFTPISLGPQLRVGALICQESILPEGPRELSRRGATLLSVSTNDVTFGSSVTTFEHLAATQLRAIEVGRDVVWASNAGPSTVIDRFGNVTLSAPFRMPAALIAPASLHDGLTPFLRSERLWPILSLGLLAVSLLTQRARTRRQGLSQGPVRTSPALTEVTRTRRRALARIVGLTGFAALSWFSSPWLVEALEGDVRRSGKALADLLTKRAPIVTRGLERFADPSSARAAARYFLEYYGADPAPAGRLPAAVRDLDQLQRELSALGVETRPIDFAQGVPRVVSLTQLGTGEFAISVHANGQGPVLLALPSRGQAIEIAPARLGESTVMRGLLPAQP